MVVFAGWYGLVGCFINCYFAFGESGLYVFSLASGLVASSWFGTSLCLSDLMWVWWVLVFGFCGFCVLCWLFVVVGTCILCGFGTIRFLLGFEFVVWVLVLLIWVLLGGLFWMAFYG